MNALAINHSARGRFAEAEALLCDSLDTGCRVLGEEHPDTAKTLYNLGCLAALRGDRAAALYWLGQAVTHGWSDGDKMAQDSDLKSLRGNPGFDSPVARVDRRPRRRV